MTTEHRRDLVRLAIVDPPHRPDYRTKSSEMDDCIIRTLFVSNGCMTGRSVPKLGLLRITPDDAVDREVSGEVALDLKTACRSFLGNKCRAGYVFVRRVVQEPMRATLSS